jgi:glycosyltransferase involved in cell wall biosynthesis
MAHLYARADVSINEFGAGWFGWAALESMSCGVPVISRIDPRGMTALYGDDWPWCHAADARELADQLERLATNPDDRAALGARCREWIQEHHGTGPAGDLSARSTIASWRAITSSTR